MTGADPTSAAALAQQLSECHEIMAGLYVALSGTRIHASDCATSCSPAYRPGPCDCRMGNVPLRLP